MESYFLFCMGNRSRKIYLRSLWPHCKHSLSLPLYPPRTLTHTRMLSLSLMHARAHARTHRKRERESDRQPSEALKFPAQNLRSPKAKRHLIQHLWINYHCWQEQLPLPLTFCSLSLSCDPTLSVLFESQSHPLLLLTRKHEIQLQWTENDSKCPIAGKNS